MDKVSVGIQNTGARIQNKDKTEKSIPPYSGFWILTPEFLAG
jgi:hypothetical protein